MNGHSLTLKSQQPTTGVLARRRQESSIPAFDINSMLFGGGGQLSNESRTDVRFDESQSKKQSQPQPQQQGGGSFLSSYLHLKDISTRTPVTDEAVGQSIIPDARITAVNSIISNAFESSTQATTTQQFQQVSSTSALTSRSTTPKHSRNVSNQLPGETALISNE